MRFNVSGLVREGIGATRTYDLDALLEADGREPEHVVGAVDMLRTRDGVLVRAHLTLQEPEVCSRCLKALEETVTIDFEEEFIATVDPRTGASLERVGDGDAFVIDENHTLDLSEAVRQYREVSLLMQPLCREDCKGLCPQCGKDLNLGPCGCESADVSGPMSVLATLKGGVREDKE